MLGSTLAPGPISVDRASRGPGLLIVDDDLKVLTITPNAERWLRELADGDVGLPEAVRSVVADVRQLHGSDIPDDQIPRARARGTSGRWLTIYASRTRGTDLGSPNTAVIIQEAKSSEIAPLYIDACGLSPSEARVADLVLQGLSTKEIASELSLSRYTVQDYVKTIFVKVGVHSRLELVAALFDNRHRPRYGLARSFPVQTARKTG